MAPREDARPRGALAEITNTVPDRKQCCVECGESILGVVCRLDDQRTVHFGCSGFKLSSVDHGCAGGRPTVADRSADRSGAGGRQTALDKLSSSHPPLVKIIFSFLYGNFQSILTDLNQRTPLYTVAPGYLSGSDEQTSRIASHRADMIRWLAALFSRVRLDPATLYRAVNVMDRYISRVDRDVEWLAARMNLAAAASARLAVKFETSDPKVLELPWAQYLGCSKKDIYDMEEDICKVVDFRFLSPTSREWLDILESLAPTENTVHFEISSVLVDLFLLHPGCMKFSALEVAAAAWLLSNTFLGLKAWPGHMAVLLEHNESTLQPCVTAMLSMRCRGAFERGAFERLEMQSARMSAAVGGGTVSPAAVGLAGLDAE